MHAHFFGLGFFALVSLVAAQSDFCRCAGVPRNTPSAETEMVVTVSGDYATTADAACRQACRTTARCTTYHIFSGSPTQCYLELSDSRSTSGGSQNSDSYIQGYVGDCSEYANLATSKYCQTRGMSNASALARRSHARARRYARAMRELNAEVGDESSDHNGDDITRGEDPTIA